MKPLAIIVGVFLTEVTLIIAFLLNRRYGGHICE